MKKAIQDHKKAIQDHNKSLKAMLGCTWPHMTVKRFCHFELTAFCLIWSNFCSRTFFCSFCSIFCSIWNKFCLQTIFVRFINEFCSRAFFVPFICNIFLTWFHANKNNSKNNKASFRTFERCSRSKINKIYRFML